jgi:hypothetical protein
MLWRCVGEWRYSLTNFILSTGWWWADSFTQPATWLSCNLGPLPTPQGAGCVPELVWTIWRQKISVDPSYNRKSIPLSTKILLWNKSTAAKRRERITECLAHRGFTNIVLMFLTLVTLLLTLFSYAFSLCLPRLPTRRLTPRNAATWINIRLHYLRALLGTTALTHLETGPGGGGLLGEIGATVCVHVRTVTL